ncbi:MAG: YceD family protein [Candidatus Kapaibacterium sp.]
MLIIPLQGMRDGHHAVELECRAEDLHSTFEEFVGTVRVVGDIRKVGRRLHLEAVASSTVRLVCDYTTKEFDDEVRAPFHCDFILSTELFNERAEGSPDDETVPVHEEEKSIDITDIVRQELAINLPLKRIAPEVRNTSLEDLVDRRFLADSASARDDRSESDDRWAALKNVSLPGEATGNPGEEVGGQ